MSKPSSDTAYLPDRIVLTQEITGEDIPLWDGIFDRGAEKRDELYGCGSNFLIWTKDAKKNAFYPTIVNPASRLNKTFSYPDFLVENLKSMIFLPGRKLDILVHPEYSERPEKLVSNIPAYFSVNFIQDGGILKQQRISLVGIPFTHHFSKHNIRLYQDKILVFVVGDTLYMFNVHTGTLTKKIEEVPRDGVLILDKNTAYIWSRIESKRAMIDLESGIRSAIGLEPIPIDMEIVGFSTQNLVVKNTEAVWFYNGGAVILKRHLNNSGALSFIGMLESYNSSTCAFLIRDLKVGKVLGCKDNYPIEVDLGYIGLRSMLLYEDRVYVAKDRSCLNLFAAELLTNEEINLTMTALEVDRFMRFSPTFGWVMEVRDLPLDSGKKIAIRGVFNRPLHLPIPVKKQWPEYTPDHCLIPPYLYHTKEGQIRIWTAEEYKTETGVKFIKTHLFAWNPIAGNIGEKLKEIGEIPLPTEPTTALWFRTDEKVILVLGRKAIVFDHDGARSLRDFELKSQYDYHIKAVKGFGQTIWILGGQTQKVKDTGRGQDVYAELIKEVIFWDGIHPPVAQMLDPGIYMRQAVATGKRDHSGRLHLVIAELIIGSVDVEAPWVKLALKNGYDEILIDPNFANLGFGKLVYKDRYLCETPDKHGRVYYSEGFAVFVYMPWDGTTIQKADLDSIRVNQIDPINSLDGDAISAMAVGMDYLWVARAEGFCCLKLDTIGDTGVTEYRLPMKPIVFYKDDKTYAQYQRPSIIRPYFCLSDLDDQTIMENEEFIWLSDRPFQPYKRPALLNTHHFSYVVITDRAEMLVLASFISNAPDGVKKTIRSALCEVIL